MDKTLEFALKNPYLAILILVLGIIFWVVYKWGQKGFFQTKEDFSQLLISGAKQLAEKCQLLEKKNDDLRIEIDSLKRDITSLGLKYETFLMKTEVAIDKCEHLGKKDVCDISRIIKDFK